MGRSGAVVMVLAATLALAACDQLKPKGDTDKGENGSGHSQPARSTSSIVQYGDSLARRANALFDDTIGKRADRAADRAADHARNAMASGDYEHVIGTYDCEDDCSNHNAGFAWARSHRIDDPHNCPGDRGDSFEEGCRAYGDQVQAAHDEAQSAVLNGKDPPTQP